MLAFIAAQKRNLCRKDVDTSSGSSKISAHHMQSILNNLKQNANSSNTKRTYHSIWRNFNNFVIRLAYKPRYWEDRVSLFLAYMVEKGAQSSTIKSYTSAIKAVLVDDGYQWDNQRILLTTLTKACRLHNDRVMTRLPIQCRLLELILFEIQRLHEKQTYLPILYKTVFSLGYGLFRVGELTFSDHVIKAANVHVALNKEKILVVLYSSKTHNLGNHPQKVKITSNKAERTGQYSNKIFCPFKLAREFMKARGGYLSEDEPFFIFKDRNPVMPSHIRYVLKTCLDRIGLQSCLYGIVGDEFAANTFTQYVTNAERGQHRLYMTENFNTMLYASRRKDSHIRSMLNRIFNQFVKAINENIVFPKAVMIVLDDDILRSLTSVVTESTNMSIVLNKIMKHLFNDSARP